MASRVLLIEYQDFTSRECQTEKLPAKTLQRPIKPLDKPTRLTAINLTKNATLNNKRSPSRTRIIRNRARNRLIGEKRQEVHQRGLKLKGLEDDIFQIVLTLYLEMRIRVTITNTFYL